VTWAVAVLRHVDGPRGEHWLHQHQDWPARGQRRFVHELEQILLCWHHTPFTLLAMAPNDGRLRVYASAYTPSALSSLAYRVRRCTTKGNSASTTPAGPIPGLRETYSMLETA
jgi:hypothetical protein